MLIDGDGAAPRRLGRGRPGEGGLDGIDGALQQFGGLLRQIVDHGLAVVAGRGVGGGLADLGVHLLEFRAETGGVGPAGDDLVEGGAILAVAGEGGGGLVVGGGDAPLGVQRVVELLAQVGEPAALAHFREHRRDAAGFAAGGLVDAAHDRRAFAVAEAVEGVDARRGRPFRPARARAHRGVRCSKAASRSAIGVCGGSQGARPLVFAGACRRAGCRGCCAGRRAADRRRCQPFAADSWPTFGDSHASPRGRLCAGLNLRDPGSRRVRPGAVRAAPGFQASHLALD